MFAEECHLFQREYASLTSFHIRLCTPFGNSISLYKFFFSPGSLSCTRAQENVDVPWRVEENTRGRSVDTLFIIPPETERGSKDL